MIRKIVTGTNYTTDGMSYTVGQFFGKNKVHAIQHATKSDMKKIGLPAIEGFVVYISNTNNEVIPWKGISINTPHTLEFFVNEF